MASVLQNVIANQLSDIRGTRIAGRVPVREDAVNAAANAELSNRNGRIQALQLKIHEGNRLELGLKVSVGPFARWFRPELIVTERAIWPQGPIIILTFASAQYNALLWVLEIFAKEFLPAGVHIKDRQMAVDISAVPQLAPYRQYLPYIKQLTISTSARILTVHFEVLVD